MLSLVLAFLPAIAIIVAVVTSSKTIAALAQQGSVQARDASAPVHKQQLRRAKKGVSLESRLTFSFGVLNVGLTCFILGYDAAKFYMWHAPKCVFLLVWRFLKFKKQGLHYYLFDFCYLVNALSLLVCGLKGGPVLFRALFFAANGPLAWSVLAFNNSLLFHSIDHITSVFIHMSPMIVTFGLHWHESDFDIKSDSDSVWDLLWPSLVLYAVWMVGYYVWVFVVRRKRVEQRGYETLFHYLLTLPVVAAVLQVLGGKVVGVGRKLKKAASVGANRTEGSETKTKAREAEEAETETVSASQDFVNKAVYLLLHYTFGLATMMLALLMWHSFYAHFAFMLAIAFGSAWNASLYYFQYIQYYVDDSHSDNKSQ